MIKKLLLLTFILVSAGVLAQSPILKNFKIENSNKNRVYFESTGVLTGLTKQGFKISGKTISSIDINDKYFTVSTPFNFWDNNTIRLENGNGTVYDFTLIYIENNISEPTATINRYVSVTGAGKHDGTSEANAWTLLEAVKKAKAGMTVWIKAGTYTKSGDGYSVTHGGTPTAPIKFKGYTTTIGDLDTDYIVDDFTYVSPAAAAAFIDETKWPLIEGPDNLDNGTEGFNFNKKDNIILKNIQVIGFAHNIYSSSNQNIHIENCTTALTRNLKARGIRSGTQETNNMRVYKCLSFDMGGTGIRLDGNFNLIKECVTWSGVSGGAADTDYQIVLYSNENSIVINNFTRSNVVASGSKGHGIGIKMRNSGNPSEYNLIYDNDIYQEDGEALYAAHQYSQYNVLKKNRIYNNYGGTGTKGMVTRNGANHNIFENNYIDGGKYAISLTTHIEDRPTASKMIVNDNIFRNNIIKNVSTVVAVNDGEGTAYRLLNNKIYNNTFYNVTKGLFFVQHNNLPKSGNEFKNNIIYGDGSISLYNSFAASTDFEQQYNNYYNIGQTTPSGTGNKSVDPNFNPGSFIPRNTALKGALPLSGVEYDYWKENENPTERHASNPTIGAEEIPDDNNTGSVNANAGQDVLLCKGESTTLTASGGTTYVWSTGATTASITVSPTETTTYSVTVSDGTNSDTDDVIVTVNEAPSVNAGSDVTICSGENVTLTASGEGNFLWSTGDTTSSIIVSPTATSTYSVTASNSCSSTATDDIVINVTADIVLDVGEDVAICSSETVILTATGNSNFLWSTGETTSSINVSPTSTTTYTVTSTSGNCSLSDEVIVTVDIPPSVSLGNDVDICFGETVTLTATGVGNFLWSTGETTSSIIVSPTATSTYTVTASNSCSADATDDVIVTVNEAPSVNAGSDVTACSSETVTLTATGNSNFLWSTGETTASIAVNPSSTTTYSVTSSNGNCSKTDDVVVTVNNIATVNAGADLTVCTGENVTLTATGSGNFLWSTGEATPSITVNPTSTTMYTVIASNSCNADATDEVKVTVIEVPTVTISDDVTIQNGSSTVLTASGNGNYSWSTGETTPSITVNPSETTTYTVILTSSEGCVSQENVIVNVTENSTTTVNVDVVPDQNICLDESVTLIATGGSNYLWSTGETTASITVSPTETTIYAVTISNGSTVEVEDVTIFVDETCSGIANRLINKESKLYPNPTQGELNIELAGFNDESNISVFDLNGRLIYSENIDNYSPIKILKRQINLSRFGRGIYFVRLINNNNSETKKVLVI